MIKRHWVKAKPIEHYYEEGKGHAEWRISVFLVTIHDCQTLQFHVLFCRNI